MSKPIILEIDNVRIGRWDDNNLFIEREETYWNPKDKAEITGYKFKGYYSTVFKALEAISVKGLLINENTASDLIGYLKQVEISNQKVIDAVGRVNADA